MAVAATATTAAAAVAAAAAAEEAVEATAAELAATLAVAKAGAALRLCCLRPSNRHRSSCTLRHYFLCLRFRSMRL